MQILLFLQKYNMFLMQNCKDKRGLVQLKKLVGLK